MSNVTSANQTGRRPTTVIFACPKCQRTYQATHERYPYDRLGRFDCVGCKTEVHAWNVLFDYAGWRALG
jgi:hypothetical protein